MQNQQKKWRDVEIGDEYWANEFLVCLSAEFPFLTENDGQIEINEERLAIFSHEHLHYFHNVSTLSGFKSILFTHKLVAAFSQTLQMDGTSLGSVANSEISAKVRFAYQERILHDGEAGPTIALEPENSNVTILSSTLAVSERELSVDEETIVWPHVIDAVEFARNGCLLKDEFVVGSLVIEEGVVFALERLIAQQLKIEALDAPTFPYKYLDFLLQQHLGTDDLFVIAAIGTLALLSTHPGYELTKLLEFYQEIKNNDPNLEPAEIIDLIASDRSEILMELDATISKDWDNVVAMREGRRLTHAAVSLLRTTHRKNLQARIEDPIFDVRRLSRDLSKGDLANFHKDNPCDVLQTRVGDQDTFKRDLLFSYFESKNTSDSLRTLQAQQSYVNAHINNRGDAFEASEQVEDPCPYLTCCTLEMREDNFDTCAKTPWAHFNRTGLKCWYGVAVSETLGTSQPTVTE